VTLQAGMTVVGNSTACLAGWWIWRQAKSAPDSGAESSLKGS
jgi:hypothetical protein